jgi:hypothetical protein
MFKKFLSFQQWFWTEYLDDGPSRAGFTFFTIVVSLITSLIFSFLMGNLIPLQIFVGLLIAAFLLGLFIGGSIFIRDRVREWRPHFESEQQRLFNTIKHSERTR